MPKNGQNHQNCSKCLFFCTFGSIISPKINIFKNQFHCQSTFFKAVLLRYQTWKSIFFRFFSPKGPPFDFKNLKTQMIGSIFDLEKNRNMFWNQGSQLFHLPHETKFFHEIFIFSTNLLCIPCTNFPTIRLIGTNKRKKCGQ